MATYASTLPPLYARRSDGKIQVWSIQVEGNTYSTVTGIIDGQMVTTVPTICKGTRAGHANATDSRQQALKEAKALWTKKMNEGYFTKIDMVDETRFFAPMLAHHYKDHHKMVEQALNQLHPVYCQPKLDGVRCIATYQGLYSRNGKELKSAPHILNSLRQHLGDGDWCFDGELYADKFSNEFNAIISLAKKQKPSPLELRQSATDLQYHIYDMPSAGAGFWNRWRQVIQTFRFIPPYIVTVQTLPVNKLDDISMLFGKWRTEGYEGAMIRLDEDYEVGKRSKHLLKYKEFSEDEFEVKGVVEGLGNRSGMAGALQFETSAGRPFTAAIMGNRDLFRRLLANADEIVGLTATVQYQNYTPDGSPRFPCVKCIRDYE